MKKHCFYTSFNKAYSFQALTLVESLKRTYGNEVEVIGVLLDELEDTERNYFSQFTSIIEAKDLDIPNFRKWIFRLDIVEAATAVKPFALHHLLQSYEQVTYLDPDICVYSPLEELTCSDGFSTFLTPHQIQPQVGPWLIESTELESLRFGVFNLGFLSVRSTSEGLQLAEWWRDRCYAYCVSEPEKGLFTDQKFFDLAPALLSGVHVLRHPGYNVATWNLREREIRFSSEEGVTSNGQPLRFCHFTKATHIGAFALERMTASSDCFFVELFYAYLARLEQKKIELANLSPRWTYGFYMDGTEIPKHTRIEYRKDPSWANRLEDPFKTVQT